MKKKFIFPFYVFLLLLLIGLLVSATYSWFAVNNPINSDDIGITCGTKATDISLRIRKNNGEYVLVKTDKDFQNQLSLCVPSDLYDFEITLTNTNDLATYNSLYLRGARNVYIDEDYYEVSTSPNGEEIKVLKADVPNLLDQIELLDRKVIIHTYQTLDDEICQEEVVQFDDIQLSKLIDSNDDFVFFNERLNPATGKIIVLFSLYIDELSSIQGVDFGIDYFEVLTSEK